jgi:predicted cupin superfamily sugar epimerase
MNAEYFIKRFHLVPHPEGGYYARTHLDGDQRFSSILFLLTRDHYSAFHRIRSEEQWNWYFGDDIFIHEIDSSGQYQPKILSSKSGAEQFQYVVKAGHWFASECLGSQGFALCGCTVVPAFRFEDFEMGDRDELIKQFPQHKSLITKFTSA